LSRCGQLFANEVGIFNMRVAIIAEWLSTYAGSERVLEKMIGCFPEADVFAVVDFLPEAERGFLLGKRPKVSFIQRLPLARKYFRHYLPWMPLAVEQFDLSAYDVILSNSHAVAKGIITGPNQLHISYVNSPMRYAWDLQPQYLREAGLERGVKGWLVRWLLHRMRSWDRQTANGVDLFLANSRFIARRIWRVYRREAEVLYPPVDVSGFSLHETKEDFYLTASRMVPYKRMDLIVEAFAGMPDKRLVVIGDGPEMAKVRAKAGPNVSLMGYQPFEVLRDYLQRAKAFVFAAEEDFGILPVEAQTCGTPVIAFGKGGALETIRGQTDQQPTGIFFDEQTPVSIQSAVLAFEGMQDRISPERCRENAMRFSEERFRDEYHGLVMAAWEEFRSQGFIRRG
jgi:glycosyltransferase involved in cell wall biosynthesis